MHAPPVSKKETGIQQSSSREGGSSTQPLADHRPETAVQMKLQELADTSGQVQALQRMQRVASPVVQLAKPDKKKKKESHYEERFTPLGKGKKTTYQRDLKKISKAAYNKLTNEPATAESGFTGFEIEATEKVSDWDLNNHVVKLNGSTIEKAASFKLPVSCIESAEHVVHYSRFNAQIPDWQDGQNKSVDLQMNNNTKTLNETAVNISKNKLTKKALKPYGSFDFGASAVQVNEGLLVIDTQQPDTTLHAVVVVGKNKSTGQIIVLERNAGETSGTVMHYIDNEWVLNIYDSPQAFLASMSNSDLVLGKLVAH